MWKNSLWCVSNRWLYNVHACRVVFYTTLAVARGGEWRIMLNKQFCRLWIPTDDHCIIWWGGTVLQHYTTPFIKLYPPHTPSPLFPPGEGEGLRPPVAASHYGGALGINLPPLTLLFDKRSVGARLFNTRKCWVGSTPHWGKGEKMWFSSKGNLVVGGSTSYWISAEAGTGEEAKRNIKYTRYKQILHSYNA